MCEREVGDEDSNRRVHSGPAFTTIVVLHTMLNLPDPDDELAVLGLDRSTINAPPQGHDSGNHNASQSVADADDVRLHSGPVYSTVSGASGAAVTTGLPWTALWGLEEDAPAAADAKDQINPSVENVSTLPQRQSTASDRPRSLSDVLAGLAMPMLMTERQRVAAAGLLVHGIQTPSVNGRHFPRY